MNKKPMIDAAPHVGAQDMAYVDVLRADNEDLRASAILWKTLYEEAQRRCVELENALTAGHQRVSTSDFLWRFQWARARAAPAPGFRLCNSRSQARSQRAVVFRREAIARVFFVTRASHPAFAPPGVATRWCGRSSVALTARGDFDPQ